MSIWDSFLQTFSPETLTQQANARTAGSTADINALKLAQLKSSLNAQSRLYGGTDPTDATGGQINWNPQQFGAPPPPVLMGQPAQNGQPAPPDQQATAPSLMGAGVPQDQIGNLMNGGPQDAQRAQLMRQADPQAAMANDAALMNRSATENYIKNLDIPNDVKQILQVANAPGGAEPAKNMSENLKTPADVQTIKMLNDAVTANGGPDDPRAAPYLQQLKIKNQQADADLAKLAETKSLTQLHLADANKPISVGTSGMVMVRNPQTGAWEAKSAFGDETPNAPLDPNNPNLSAQIGLSEGAIRFMTGQTKGTRIGQAQAQKYNNEITQWGIKNGVNISTLAPQATGAFSVMQNNIQRNNQGKILEQEIMGSVDNASDIVNDIGQGKINIANVVKIWGGQQINDPKSIQAADQLGRLRDELAGYNAVAGGHLMQNGQPEPTPADFKNAEQIITNGINSGGLKALSNSIKMSADKNSRVLQGSVDSANQDYFNLFGAKYHSQTPANSGPSANPAITPVTSVAPLPKPANAPVDAKPSPKNGKWYSPAPGKPGQWIEW